MLCAHIVLCIHRAVENIGSVDTIKCPIMHKMSDTSIFYINKVQSAKSMGELDTVAFLLTVNKVMIMKDREKVAKYLMQRKEELLTVTNE